MANYCFNSLEISANRKDIEKFENFITPKKPDEQEKYDLTKIIPLETDSVDEAYQKWKGKVSSLLKGE